jgi:hypothetical protein
MKEWFYSQFGQTKGPVSLETVLQLLLTEDLELDDYVTDGIDQPWKKVKDIPEIMQKVHTPQEIPHATELPENWLTEEGEVRGGNLYFYIPIKRFILMSIVTLGLYQIYWFYKQWYFWARKHKQGYRSPDREMGWILFPWTLLQKIETDRELNAVERSNYSGTLVFWLWVGMGTALYLLVAGISNFSENYRTLGYAFLSLDVLMLLPVQRYINRVNAKLGNTYDKPGFGHYVCLAVPIIMLVFYFVWVGIQALFV